MEDKFKPENSPSKHAAGTCAATCHKCEGHCAEQAAHNGPHKCDGGHSW